MPAESEQQRKVAGSALSAKYGKKNPKELYGPARQMYESMTEE